MRLAIAGRLLDSFCSLLVLLEVERSGRRRGKPCRRSRYDRGRLGSLGPAEAGRAATPDQLLRADCIHPSKGRLRRRPLPHPGRCFIMGASGRMECM